MSAVAFCASIYMTLAVTVERFKLFTKKKPLAFGQNQLLWWTFVLRELFAMGQFSYKLNLDYIKDQFGARLSKSSLYTFCFSSQNIICYYLPKLGIFSLLVQFSNLTRQILSKWVDGLKIWPKTECSRYIAVCRPHQYRAISLTMTNARRLLVYIVPVTALSFALNVPKFMEVTVTEHNGTNEVDASQTRKDPTFIFWWDLQIYIYINIEEEKNSLQCRLQQVYIQLVQKWNQYLPWQGTHFHWCGIQRWQPGCFPSSASSIWTHTSFSRSGCFFTK